MKVGEGEENRVLRLMMSLSDTLQNEGKKKESIASTEALKDKHYNLKKRFTNFIDFYNFEEDFIVVLSHIEAFVEQEHNKNEKLCQLSIKFLSEEDQNLLDFLSEDESFIGFLPLERRTEFSHDIRQLADRDKVKLILNEKKTEAIKKERFLNKMEGSNEEREEEKLQSLKVPGVSRSRKKTFIKLHKKRNKYLKAMTGKIWQQLIWGVICLCCCSSL